MSEAENGITLPPQDLMVANGSAVMAWRAVYDSIRVDALPDGSRHLRVTREGVLVFACTLSPEAAAHLAGLLGGEAGGGEGASVSGHGPKVVDDTAAVTANDAGGFA